MTQPSMESHHGHQFTVLHVDPYLVSADLIARLVSRRSDLRLISACTGSQCLQLASEDVPDVIVLEVDLLDMDGIELVATLRKLDTTAHIPIIALSTNAFPKHILRGMAAGLFCYLTQPFRFTELLQAIDDALLSCETLK